MAIAQQRDWECQEKKEDDEKEDKVGRRADCKEWEVGKGMSKQQKRQCLVCDETRREIVQAPGVAPGLMGFQALEETKPAAYRIVSP